MKRITFLSAIISSFMLFGAQSALADDCLALSGSPAGAECVVNTPRTVTGTFNLSETLHITGAGSIDASGGGITLNICVAPAVPSPSCDLLIDGGGEIEADDTGASGASASDITIKVSRNVVMQAGSAILADNTVDGGAAGNITITAGGDMTMCAQTGTAPGAVCVAPAPNTTPGALISARKESGGAVALADLWSVTITVGDKTKATGNFYMEGGVTTYGHETGATIDTTSSTSHAGNIDITAGKTYFTEPGSVVQAGDPLLEITATRQGGKIFLVSDCGLTSEGRVTSKGPDFGADLVHLESCEVIIRGLVESTGKGHVPDAPNSCDLINDGLPGEVLRDHPPNSTGCIEVWGNLITIDSSTLNPATKLPWAGELNADIGNGGPEGTSWIDIFAFSKLTVIDGTGNDFLRDNFGPVYFSTYAVHANNLAGTSDTTPAVITALVKNGPLTASGKAFEASSTLTADTGHAPGPFFTGNGSFGGTIDLEASGTVTLDTAFVNASGDFFGGSPCPSGSGQCGQGGHIIVSAWGTGSNVSWTSGSGDVRPNDDGGSTGDIKLNACGSITTGADFHGESPDPSNNCSASQPTIPTITVANRGPVFKTDLWALCGSSSISGLKFNDLNGNHVRDAGEPGLNGWTITLWNAAQTVAVATTTTAGPPDGSYSFTGVAPGTYVVCETIQSGWQQTAPVAGSGVVACLTGGLGYTIVICSDCVNGTCAGTPITGKDFGNTQIQKGSKSGVKWNDVNGNGIREAGDVGLNGWVMHLFGVDTSGLNVHQTQTTHTATAADLTCPAGPGCYYFGNLNPGTYHVCEQLLAGWNQTFPAGLGFFACPGADPAADNPTPGPLGYTFTITGGDAHTGNDFGNHTTTCQKPTAIAIMNEAFPLNKGPDITVQTWLPGPLGSVQYAVDNVTDTNNDGFLIIMVIAHPDGSLGGSAAQNVIVSKDYGTKAFGLIGCSVTLTGGGAGPAISITDAAKGASHVVNTHTTTIFVADLHGGSSGVGVEAHGSYRYLRNEGAGSNGTGFLVSGNYNTVHNGSASGNSGVGLKIDGDNNYVTDTGVFSNTLHGVQVTGNNNQLLKINTGKKGQGNGGDGLTVSGSGNLIQEVNAYANTGNGISASGGPNTLNKNVSGDRGTGNGGAGFLVGGGSSLLQNTAIANTGDGFHLLTSGFSLKNDVSGGSGTGYANSGCQYRFDVAGNTNAGGDKSNGVTLVGTPFPAGCK